MTKDEALKDLRKYLKPGTTVHCILRSRAPSGMSRRIDFLVFKKDQPYFITYSILCAFGRSSNSDKPGMLVKGCGMDMGFHVVSTLSRMLYPNAERPDYQLHCRWL